MRKEKTGLRYHFLFDPDYLYGLEYAEDPIAV